METKAYNEIADGASHQATLYNVQNFDQQTGVINLQSKMNISIEIDFNIEMKRNTTENITLTFQKINTVYVVKKAGISSDFIKSQGTDFFLISENGSMERIVF